MSEDEGQDWGDGPVYFLNCTCDHDEDQHGWGSCNVEDCPCEGGWEE